MNFEAILDKKIPIRIWIGTKTNTIRLEIDEVGPVKIYDEVLSNPVDIIQYIDSQVLDGAGENGIDIEPVNFSGNGQGFWKNLCIII